MTLADHIKILDNLQDLDAHYPNISVSATYDFYTGTTSVYIDSDLGFTFTDYKQFRHWYKGEFLPALADGEDTIWQ
jgi:hypothetical protein